MSTITRKFISVEERVANVIFWAAFALLDEQSPVYNLTKQLMLEGRAQTARHYCRRGVNEILLAGGKISLVILINNDGKSLTIKVDLLDKTKDGNMADIIGKIKMEWLAYNIVDEEGYA